MNMKRILLGAAVWFGVSLFDVHAQENRAWTPSQSEVRSVDTETYKAIVHDLNKGGTMALQVHGEGCTWNGVDGRLFSDIQSMKEYGFRDSSYADRMLSGFSESLERGTKLAQGSDAPFILHIWLKKVSKLAGMQVDFMVVYEDSIPVCRASLSVPDGRWNDFPTLFAENSEKLVRNLRKVLQDLLFYRDERGHGEWLIAKTKSKGK